MYLMLKLLLYTRITNTSKISAWFSFILICSTRDLFNAFDRSPGAKIQKNDSFEGCTVMQQSGNIFPYRIQVKYCTCYSKPLAWSYTSVLCQADRQNTVIWQALHIYNYTKKKIQHNYKTNKCIDTSSVINNQHMKYSQVYLARRELPEVYCQRGH